MYFVQGAYDDEKRTPRWHSGRHMTRYLNHYVEEAAGGHDSPRPAKRRRTLSRLRSFSERPCDQAGDSVCLSVRVPSRISVAMRSTPMACTASWHRCSARHTDEMGPSTFVP